MVVSLTCLLPFLGSIFVMFTEMKGWDALLDSSHFPDPWSNTEVRTERSVVDGSDLAMTPAEIMSISSILGPSSISHFSSLLLLMCSSLILKVSSSFLSFTDLVQWFLPV